MDLGRIAFPCDSTRIHHDDVPILHQHRVGHNSNVNEIGTVFVIHWDISHWSIPHC